MKIAVMDGEQVHHAAQIKTDLLNKFDITEAQTVQALSDYDEKNIDIEKYVKKTITKKRKSGTTPLMRWRMGVIKT